MDAVNTFPPPELAHLVSQAGVTKSKLSYPEIAVKTFMGGVFISFGALTDLVIASGCPGLRESNPALATMIAGFTFPLGLVLIMLTNMELVTSNMFVMPFTWFQRKITLCDLVKNWVLGYVGNLAGSLFVAGFLAWWTNTVGSPSESAYTVSQAEGRVNVQWSANFLRGVGCNWFVALALFLSLGSVEFVSKIYCIWIPIWAFVILGYQHNIANFFQVPLGMFYGTNFSVGKFIYRVLYLSRWGTLSGERYLGQWCFGFCMEDKTGLTKRRSHLTRTGKADKPKKSWKWALPSIAVMQGMGVCVEGLTIGTAWPVLFNAETLAAWYWKISL